MRLTCCRLAFARSSVSRMRVRSEPNIFSTTLPRTPLTASSTLSLIGCEKLNRTPGISVTEARIAWIRASFRMPGRHIRRAASDARTLGLCLCGTGPGQDRTQRGPVSRPETGQSHVMGATTASVAAANRLRRVSWPGRDRAASWRRIVRRGSAMRVHGESGWPADLPRRGCGRLAPVAPHRRSRNSGCRSPSVPCIAPDV